MHTVVHGSTKKICMCLCIDPTKVPSKRQNRNQFFLGTDYMYCIGELSRDRVFLLQERWADGPLSGPGQAFWPKQWGHVSVVPCRVHNWCLVSGLRWSSYQISSWNTLQSVLRWVYTAQCLANQVHIWLLLSGVGQRDGDLRCWHRRVHCQENNLWLRFSISAWEEGTTLSFLHGHHATKWFSHHKCLLYVIHCSHHQVK